MFVLACVYLCILGLLKLHTVSGRKRVQRGELRFQDSAKTGTVGKRKRMADYENKM